MHRTARALAILALLVPVALAGSWHDAGRDFYRELRVNYPGLSTNAEAYMVSKAEQVCANGATDALWATWDNGSQISRDFWNLSIEHLCPEHTDQMKEQS